MRGAPEEKKPQKMVRSSIACSRCRRSKVKCVNEGVNTPCKACQQSNRECSYPSAGTSTPTTKRSEAPVGIKVEGETGESKKRVRKVEDIGRRNSQKPGEDVLESPLLTKKLWNELYEIFKQHFSTELPFLHPPTFRLLMRNAAIPRETSSSMAEIEESRVILLGVLALTARFHPTLVAHHSPGQEDPVAASEYYASALAAALGPTIRTISKPSLANIQALLMIGLYDWGQCRGLSAWLYVGLAIRLALPTGLAVEDDPEKPTPDSSQSSPTPRDDAIDKEVRRRTLWSCFIMDRMLSAGKQRPMMIDVDMLRVQLPCSDDQFLFVHDVKTAFLQPLRRKDKTEISRELTPGNDEGALSKYIRLVDIFGRISTWSYAGGRRAPEQLPPWEEKSEFVKLRAELEEFKKTLPPSLTYTEENLSAHIEKRNATTYASLHTLYCLCAIVLHREYIPHVPMRCRYPEGPLDSPTFPPEIWGDKIPVGFWLKSAEIIMKASHDIIVIAQTCQENNALPESPQVGFAVWQAGFVSLYAGWFPHMDTEKHLLKKDHAVPPERRLGRIGQTWKLLTDILPRLKMINGHLKSFQLMEKFYREARVTFAKSSGGGLEHYKKLEKDLKEFGELKDVDQVSDYVDQTRSRASTNEISSNTNGEPMTGVENSKPERGWQAVNHGVPAAKTSSPPIDDMKLQYQTPHPFGAPLHSPNQNSNAPSLMSASNGDTPPGVSSPFISNQYPATQPSHAGHFPSVAGHTMAPPQYTDDISNMANIDYRTYENMSMPPVLDGFLQDAALGLWEANGNGMVQQPFYQPTWAYYGKEGQGVPLGIQ